MKTFFVVSNESKPSLTKVVKNDGQELGEIGLSKNKKVLCTVYSLLGAQGLRTVLGVVKSCLNFIVM